MSADTGKRLLIVANETVGGKALIDAVARRASEGPVDVTVICPQNQPRHGYVLHDDAVRAGAENRLAVTLAELREIGVEGTGEVVDPDPYTAIMDIVDYEDYDEIIVSTYPETRSGWLRKDLVDRVREDADVPVEHVIVETGGGDDSDVVSTLVVANQTVGGEPLIAELERRAQERPHSFIVICPKSEEDGDAASRLAHTLHRLHEEGLEAIGQIAHPDPYTAIQNALQAYAIDEIVISTFPETRSGWLRADLVERARSASSKPVEHVVVADDRTVA